jgi:hypothetical protein
MIDVREEWKLPAGEARERGVQVEEIEESAL